MYLRFNKSLLINLIKIPIGVTTKKNIIPITIGEINLPSNNPNLNQIRLSGDKNLELAKPSNKKINEIIKDQYRIILSLINGHRPIIKNTTKNKRPKLLFDPIFISLSFNLNQRFLRFHV